MSHVVPMVILQMARDAYVTKCTLQNSGQFMRSFEVSGTGNVEENLVSFHTSVHVRGRTSPPSNYDRER